MDLRLVSLSLVVGQAVVLLVTLIVAGRVWLAHLRAMRRADRFDDEPRLVGRSPLRPGKR